MVFLCQSTALFSQDPQVVETHYFSEEFKIPNYIAFDPNDLPEKSELGQLINQYWKGKEGFDLRLKDQFEDQQGEVHFKYVQTFQGYDIEFAEWIIHTKDGKIRSMNGKLLHNYPRSANISLSESQALESALASVDADVYKWQLKAEEDLLKQIQGDLNASYFPEAELAFMSKDLDLDHQKLRLCYKFNIYAHKPMSRQEVYVDAQNGEIIFTNNLIHTANTPATASTGYSGSRSITTDSTGLNAFRLRQTASGGGVNTYDLNNATNFGGAVDFTNTSTIWNLNNAQQNQYALDAHWGAEQTYDYLFTQFGRNSIDNSGFVLNSYVHYGNNFVNAFWNGQWMTYGDGNSNVTPLTALDIAGHEIAHGLTNFSANLIYQLESGALNESFSDIFGTALEFYSRPSRANWTMGEDIGFSLRNMANPNQYSDPDTYGGSFWINQVGCVPNQQNDLCGVHINSGVQNFWFYLVTLGGTGVNDNSDSYNVNAIGINKAEAIAYRNLTVYLGRNSNFQEARFYSIKAAIDLYGACSNEVASVTRAWYAVGVGANYVNSVIADFSSSDTASCIAPFTVNFADISTNGISYDWDFGDSNTDTLRNPVHTYSNFGTYDVTLIVDGGSCGVDTLVKTAYIDIDTNNTCVAVLGNGPSPRQTDCSGKIIDSGGGSGNYANNQSGTITIAPQGASSVSLTFVSFDVEAGSSNNVCDYDYLEIFDGGSINAPLIGRYCNNQPPPTSITSTRGEITLQFVSDQALTEAGFEIDWLCSFPTASPFADFLFDVDSTCTGLINFTDQSTQAPNSWLWDFGDGSSSTLRDPSHTYIQDGTYTVSLTSSNSFGSDTETKTGVIYVDRPVGPAVTNDTSCIGQTANLIVNGVGDLRWYDSEVGGNLLHIGYGLNITQPANDSVFWVEDYVASPTQNGGPINNSFGNGGNYSGDQYLVFDVYRTMVLEDVFVYSYSLGPRTIELRDANGNVLQSRRMIIPNSNGQPINISLDFTIEPGLDYQLGIDYSGNGPQLYRNSSGASYPYTVPGLMSIKRSSATSNPFAFYYFFYFWRVKELDCVSPRTPVIAKIDSSCGVVSINEKELQQKIAIYPNPANDLITVELPSHQGALELDLWSIEGKKVRDLYVASESGSQVKRQYDLSDLPAGLYLIKITTQTTTFTKRLIVH
jgi:Zn-dependent metalloprotease